MMIGSAVRAEVTVGVLNAAGNGWFVESRNCAVQPFAATVIQSLNNGAGQFGHVGLDLEAEARLQIGKVAVAVRKLLEQGLVKLETGSGIKQVDAVFLVD